MAKSACCIVRQRPRRNDGDTVRRSAWLALAAGLALALGSTRARAQTDDCEPLREIHPLPDEALPVDGSIWDICYFVSAGDREGAQSDDVCAAPKLWDAQGKAIELILDRRADAPPTRLITRYRPATPLQVGASYKLDPGAFSSPSGPRNFRVVEANSNPPAPPVIEALDYSVMGSSAEARFRFAPFGGLLVKDVGAHGSVSLAAIDVSHVSEGSDPRPFVRLARRPCMENFAAEPGASTSLRFGVFDLAASFSGWGETRLVQFPATDTAAPSTDAEGEDAQDGGCALRAPGRSSPPAAWLALVCVAVQRLRRKARQCRART
ncbi:MAG: hypothetical protein ABI895_03565 [Deltaproteobacteria bacterium]